jgi:hypothetical protein
MRVVCSLAMLKGVFHKGVAYLGIVTGALGIMSEGLIHILGVGYYIYGVLFLIWLIAVGWKLYRLGSSNSHSGWRRSWRLGRSRSRRRNCPSAASPPRGDGGLSSGWSNHVSMKWDEILSPYSGGRPPAFLYCTLWTGV